MSSPLIAQPLACRVLGSARQFLRHRGMERRRRTSGPPRWIAPLHLHRNDDEAWYVLEGKLCVKAGDDTVEASAGAGVMVPRGTPHTYWNPHPTPVRYLLVMTPAIHQLIQALHATTDRSPDAMRALFRRFDSELL